MREPTEPLMPSLASTLDTEVVQTGGDPTYETGATTPAPQADDAPRPRPAGPLTPGVVLAERYRIARRLGGGGMGEVYLAQHLAIGKQVAIKVLNADLAHRPALVERFLIEARSASSVRHDNVVDITDFGHLDGGTPFFVMAYLEGEDLRAKLTREGRLSWAQAKPLALQILAALQAAHDAGIIHRDMKPDNCFCLEQSPGRQDEDRPNTEQLKVMDFGIAKVVTEGQDHELTQTGVVIGTASYMSPEQAQSLTLDHRTDLYSVGVILYQMLTGTVPFKATGFMGVLSKHITDEPERPHQRCPEADLSPELEAIILSALAKSPGARPSSAREFAALLRAQPDHQVRASPAASRPLRSAALAVGGLAMLAVVGAIVGPRLMADGHSTADQGPTEPADDAPLAALGNEADPRFSPALGGENTREGLLAVAEAVDDQDAAGPQPGLADPTPSPTPPEETTPEPEQAPKPETKATKPVPKPAPKPRRTAKKAKSGGGAAPADDAAKIPADAPRDMKVAIGDLRAAARRCGQKHGGLPGVQAKVRLSVGPSGDAKVNVLKPFSGTPLGRCIEDEMSEQDYGAGPAKTVTVGAPVG